MKVSKTENSKKCLVLVPGGLHDLLTNEMILITDKSLNWIDEQLQDKESNVDIGNNNYSVNDIDLKFSDENQKI